MCPFGARRPYAALERLGRGGHHLSAARSRRAISGNALRRARRTVHPPIERMPGLTKGGAGNNTNPVLAMVTVFTFLWARNDFTGPLLFLTNPKNFTMALGLQDFQSQRTMIWNQLMAAATVFTVPMYSFLLRPKDLHSGHQADRLEGMRRFRFTICDLRLCLKSN